MAQPVRSDLVFRPVASLAAGVLRISEDFGSPVPPLAVAQAARDINHRFDDLLHAGATGRVFSAHGRAVNVQRSHYEIEFAAPWPYPPAIWLLLRMLRHGLDLPNARRRIIVESADPALLELEDAAEDLPQLVDRL